MFRIAILAAVALAAASPSAAQTPEPASMYDAHDLTADQRAVRDADTRFQAATKANDAPAINAALPQDYILITPNGGVVTKADLVNAALEQTTVYELQDPSQQTVRVWGDTAVITALLRIKGVREGKPIDYSLWYSDTYVRTAEGWRYVLGQAGAVLPAA